MAPDSKAFAFCSKCDWSAWQVDGPTCPRCNSAYKWKNLPQSGKSKRKAEDSDEDEDPKSSKKHKTGKGDASKKTATTRAFTGSRKSGKRRNPKSEDGSELDYDDKDKAQSASVSNDTKGSSGPQWCFVCHNGSHWEKPTCIGTQAHLYNAPNIGWSDQMLHENVFSEKKSIKPRTAIEFMHHLQHFCNSIDASYAACKNRDVVLKKVSQDNNLLLSCGVSTKVNAEGQNAYAMICAQASTLR